MSLLTVSPTLGSRSSMGPNDYFRRSSPTKPFLLKADRPRSVTMGASLLNKASLEELSKMPTTLYDMRQSTSQEALRRRIVSMSETLSPRSTLLSMQNSYHTAPVRRASQLALDSLYDSSPDSSPPHTPDEQQANKHQGWQFPLPPTASSPSKQAPSLDLCQDVLPGLGLEGLTTYTFADPVEGTEALMTPSTNTYPQSSSGHYDSDNPPSSHWSPSTYAPSICEEHEEEISFTAPLSVLESSATQITTNGEEEMESFHQHADIQGEYLRPLSISEDGDDAKLERLCSSFSLLGMTTEIHQEQDDGRRNSVQESEPPASPAPAINLRLLLSPERGAPSLAEQLAFACGNGYQYRGHHDRSHRDSSAEYVLPRALSPLVMSPVHLSLDPFSGLEGECGDSWSESHHNGCLSERHEDTFAHTLKRGLSVCSTHGGASAISDGSPILSGHMAAKAFICDSVSGQEQSEGYNVLSVPSTKASSENVAIQEQLSTPVSNSDNAVQPNIIVSDAPQTLEEFSYLALLEEDEDTLPQSPPLDQSLVEVISPLTGIDSDEEVETSNTPISSVVSSEEMRTSLSMGDILASDLVGDHSTVHSSPMKRSSTSTSILDRGRPIRPASAASFLGWKDETLHVIRLKNGLSNISAPKTTSTISSPASTKEMSEGACETAQIAAETIVQRAPAEKARTRCLAEDAERCAPINAHNAAVNKEEGRPRSVRFRPDLPSVVVASRARVASSSTARGVPMGMSRSTSRQSMESQTKTVPKVLSPEASAALREAKKEFSQGKTVTGILKGGSQSASKSATHGGVQSGKELRQHEEKRAKTTSSTTASAFLQQPQVPERSHSAPTAPASTIVPRSTKTAVSPPRPTGPLQAASSPPRDKTGHHRNLPTSLSLPTLFTARTASQRVRGETGLPETQATLLLQGGGGRSAARSHRKTSSPIARLLTESGVLVDKAKLRNKRWAIVKTLSDDEREKVEAVTPSGCVLILQEHVVVKEAIVVA